jgi:hypothetical protein
MVHGRNEAFQLDLTCRRLSPFFSFLQGGFNVTACTGCTINSFLQDQLGINPDYVDERIKTVFLNGSPVDDFDTTLVGDGDALALSAAMPGLVGAVMRKGGVLASFRHSISAQSDAECKAVDQGTVTIKLFNLLVKELGAGFLSRGIWIKSDDFKSYLDRSDTLSTRECMKIEINGSASTVDQVADRLIAMQDKWILLKVAAEP